MYCFRGRGISQCMMVHLNVISYYWISMKHEWNLGVNINVCWMYKTSSAVLVAASTLLTVMFTFARLLSWSTLPCYCPQSCVYMSNWLLKLNVDPLENVFKNGHSRIVAYGQRLTLLYFTLNLSSGATHYMTFVVTILAWLFLIVPVHTNTNKLVCYCSHLELLRACHTKLHFWRRWIISWQSLLKLL